MTTPIRIQLSRKKGWRMPPNTVKVDRSTKWGNPFSATQTYVAFEHQGFPIPLVHLCESPSTGRCIDLFVAYLKARLERVPDLLSPLRGKNLACWCASGALCHADVLLALANSRQAKDRRAA